jgi:hypothetical protein
MNLKVREYIYQFLIVQKGMQIIKFHNFTTKDIDEKMDIPRISEVASHRFKHTSDQFRPHEFVKDIKTK